MRYIYSTLIICLFSFIFFSCGIWLLPPLEVVSITAENTVNIVFSAQPSEESIIKAFSMTEEGQSVSGTFSFNDKTVVFSPLNGIRTNYEYYIIISTTAEDKNGNSLLKDFEYRFYTKQDIENPEILDIIPANESNLILAPEKISITFSKTIDTVSFEKSVSISPSITYILEWNNEFTAVDIIPAKPLNEGTRYTITVNTTLTDIYRNAMLSAFRSTFLYGFDRNPPEILIYHETKNGVSDLIIPDIINQNIPSDSDFIIEFNKRVQIESIAGFVEITPSISITVIPDIAAKNSARIQLNQKPEWEKSYTIKLKKGITDTFGNKTEEDIIFPIVFNLEKHRPVVFSGGALVNNTEYELINSATNYSAITLDVVHFVPGGNTETPTELYYAFRISNDAHSLSLVSAMQAISISTRNSCAYISLRTMNFLTAADLEYDDIYALLDDNNGGKLCILKIGIDIENSDNRGFIIFSIRNNISDNLGNTMVESLSFTLNKQ